MRMPNRLIALLSLVALAACYNPTSKGGDEDTYDCAVDSQWFTHPSMPTEVAKSNPDGSSDFCDFYQFSTQAYAYLMSPSKSDPSIRNFQDSTQFPVLEFDGDIPANACDDEITGRTLRTHLLKFASAFSTGQAGGGATIYAQDGNVAYYEVRFSRSMCDLTSSAVEMQKQSLTNFPSGTTEIKMAWKVLSDAEIQSGKFVTQKLTSDSSDQQTLGLLGMHLAIATKDHPEFVWATYEHLENTPNCDGQGTQTDTQWTFAKPSCTASLPNLNKDNCDFNDPEKNLTEPTGTPTNICRVHPYGTASGDYKAALNLANIVSQNANIYQALTSSGVPKSLGVLNNYFNVGDLWVSDIAKNSGGVGVPNERGSLRLANTVAETDYQNVNLNSTFSSNCFGCHNYIGTGESVNNNITSMSLSHIFRDIKVGQGVAVDITSSTAIADNSAAPKICGGKDGVCQKSASYLKWNGQWTNVNPSAGSVCGCELK